MNPSAVSKLLRSSDGSTFCSSDFKRAGNERKRESFSPGSLDLDVVLWNESFLSVHLSFEPVVLPAQNLKRNKDRQRERKGQRSGACPDSHAHLQDVAFPEAELSLTSGRKIILSLRFHQDGAGPMRIWGRFCRRRLKNSDLKIRTWLRLTGRNQLQS